MYNSPTGRAYVVLREAACEVICRELSQHLLPGL